MKTNPFEKFLGPEDIVHRQVCQYVKWKYRGAVLHHSPNEGKRTPFERWKIEQLNTSAGFPDIFIFFEKSEGAKVIAVELKAGNNKATQYQQAWIDQLNAVGIPAKVCNGYDSAIAFIDENFSKKEGKKVA